MKAETKEICRFLTRAIGVVLPALLPFLIWYAAVDPYMVLRHYDTYFPNPDSIPARIGINKGLITITNFQDRTAEGRSYNAFIFGSSISCYYDAKEWAETVSPSGDASPYHFDSSSESIVAMSEKIQYLDRINQPLAYALIVLDPIVMNSDDASSPFSINPPQLHKSPIETLRYHYTFFRAATNADFLKSWIPTEISGTPVENGRNMVFEPQPIKYDPILNEESIPLWDSIISSNPGEFYDRYPLSKAPDAITDSQEILTGKNEEALRRIAEIFTRRHTDYRIIIGPNRKKVALNRNDLKKMKEIFDSRRVHDFSRSMAGALDNDTLLYDDTHYRKAFATTLMHKAYNDK